MRVTICHCTWCQRRTGSAFGTEVVYAEDQVAVTDGSESSYRHLSDESGRWFDVRFCSRCGTNLGFMLEAAPGIRTLPAGAFDDPDWINADNLDIRHVFVRSRCDWSDLSCAASVYEEHFQN